MPSHRNVMALGVGLLQLLAAGCTSGSKGLESPTSPGPATSIVVLGGVVRAERPAAFRMPMPPPTQAGVTVAVISGPGDGRSTVSDAQGTYTLQVPPGPFRLRWIMAGFLPIESELQSAASGTYVALPEVILKTAPWSVAGIIADSRGTPIPGATVTLEFMDAFLSSITALSGADGRYRMDSVRAHHDEVRISVSRPGFLPALPRPVACCAPPADTIYDVTLAPIVSVK